MTAKIKPIRQDDLQAIHNLSVIVSRLNLASKLGQSYGTDRDLYQALGYPTTIEYNDFYVRYRRQDIVKAVVDKPIKATWGKGFEVYESSDDNETDFEKAFEELSKRLSLPTVFSRVDRLCAFGKYSVLLLGFADTVQAGDFQKPIVSAKELKFIRPFGQNSAQIQTWDTDPMSERYGKPLLYSITTSEPGAMATETIVVHFSRIIHITEDLLESETEGVSRLEAPYNRFMDIEKLVGGSAEMFWRGARPGYHGKVDPDYTMTPETKEDLINQLDEYEHNLRRVFVNQGVDMNALAQQVADPASHIDAQIQMISAVTGIPKRVLVGSERGELASTQDQDAWYALIEDRRETFAEPAIVRPVIDRCILYGILPEPAEDDYQIDWPPMFEQSDEAKARVGAIRSTALKDYSSNPQAESIVPPEAFFEFFLGFDTDQIELIKEQADAAMAEEEKAMKAVGITPEQLDQIQNPNKYIDGRKIIPGTEPQPGQQQAPGKKIVRTKPPVGKNA